MGHLNEMDQGGREGGRRIGGTTPYVRGKYKSFMGTNLTVVRGIYQFIATVWYCFFLAYLVLGVVYTKHFLGAGYTIPGTL